MLHLFRLGVWLTAAAAGWTATATAAETIPLLNQAFQLRSGATPEWAEYADRDAARAWSATFEIVDPTAEVAIRVLQEDVKQAWVVKLNGRPLGELVRDENRLWSYFETPADLLTPRDNRLEILPAAGALQAPSDDVVLLRADVVLESRASLLRQTRLIVRVRDERGPLPCRITLTDPQGALPPLGGQSDRTQAIRHGTVYTLSGEAEAFLPAGEYQVLAGRGPEYSLDQRTVRLQAGETRELEMSLRREVDTRGWAACDTHIHTLTDSGHGDATVVERMITLAGEGIELAVATDHNVNIDHREIASQLGASRYLTPVVGNEVTTRLGHFNVFPLEPDAPPPNHRGADWPAIFGDIEAAPSVKAVILNHPRDLHAGFRPFAPANFLAPAGAPTRNGRLRIHAVEVLNSSATQSDPLRLLHDWMALLNHGLRVTPVGCSDSHDVLRHFVGQGRTYIRCDDRDPAAIPAAEAVENFIAGRVMVSYGLIVELIVADRWRSGETAAVAGRSEIPVRLRVLGPRWINADQITLFANGQVVRSEALRSGSGPPTGVLWEADWLLPTLGHDVFLTAVAEGPGERRPFWRAARPYQPVSTEWTPRFLGCSGAVWLDVDGDGRASSARDYALRVLARKGPELSPPLLQALAEYDQATATQAAFALHEADQPVLSDAAFQLLEEAAPQVRQGFREFWDAWRDSLANP